MSHINTWIKKQKFNVLSTISIGLLFGLSLIFIFIENIPALALTISNPKINFLSLNTQTLDSTLSAKELTNSTTDEIDEITPSPLELLITTTQDFFNKESAQINDVIATLSQQLEQASTENDPTIRKQIKKDLENKQDTLENAADSIDNLSEKWQKIAKSLVIANESNLDIMKNQLQEKVNRVQQSFEKLAKLVDNLADNTEKAKKMQLLLLKLKLMSKFRLLIKP